MYQVQCRKFNGYKPCTLSLQCDEQCAFYDHAEVTILIVHLGAMGAVVRSTALLRMIKKKFPSSHITWVTEDSSIALLENNTFVDRILGISSRDQLKLSAMEFDIGYFIDKAPEVEGLRKLAQPRTSFGFSVNAKNGAVIPLNAKAIELWELGLDNNKKFKTNTKSELQLLAEALELPFSNEEYLVPLTFQEERLAQLRHQQWSHSGKKVVVGLNTGTSGYLPKKTIPIEFWRSLIQHYQKHLGVQIVLLGGPSDHKRNQLIGSGFEVVLSPDSLGLRDGLCSVKAVDIVMTADSLGMHMAIAMKKYVVAWFGPSCHQEIDLYGRGTKILSPLNCSPCWARDCQIQKPCNELISVNSFCDPLDSFIAQAQLLKNNEIAIDSEGSMSQVETIHQIAILG